MGMRKTAPLKFAEWTARLAAAGILLQTLFFKFTGAAESRYIFETLGLEPFGRVGSGIVELIAAVLILLPAARFAAVGAFLAVSTMSGAIFFHLTKLGIVVQNDGGTLFAMAIVVFLASTFVLLRNLYAYADFFTARCSVCRKALSPLSNRSDQAVN